MSPVLCTLEGLGVIVVGLSLIFGFGALLKRWLEGWWPMCEAEWLDAFVGGIFIIVLTTTIIAAARILGEWLCGGMK